MGNYFNVFKNIYVDLDAILDTRLGTLYFLDKGLYDYYKGDGKDFYINRLIDEFEYIPNNVFKYYYNLRNGETLKHSPLTPLLDVLTISVEDMIVKRLTADKNIKKLVIDVNIYPYVLKDETIENLKKIITAKIGNEFTIVNMINVSYSKLTTRTRSLTELDMVEMNVFMEKSIIFLTDFFNIDGLDSYE